ncbi:DUF3703 domain-containing protein [Melaminivora sp.]|uniref:DUF3703 domain-containing protein n=1 Tax=Melaminivora sp. TaxID=1933032 RepID=UPI0028A67900|nr:DUF3703 domain-containing protein [Melaminivora sp.]
MTKYVKTPANPAGRERQRQAFDHLMAAFEASAGRPPRERWLYLEAAHVIGQSRLALHWRAHRRMLAFARELRDEHEVQGQWRQLGYAVFGHVVRRIPQGNTGRALVPAFRTMVPSAAVRACITDAMAAVAP